jgi:uncharacterized protein
MSGAIEELTADEIDAFLAGQIVGRVGCHTDGVTYVVPVIYAYSEGCVHVYTVEGRKVEMMRRNPSVCFEVDEYDVDGRGGWRSVIVQGEYEELDGPEAQQVLELLGARFADRSEGGSERRSRGGGRAAVAFRIRVASATGRAVHR